MTVSVKGYTKRMRCEGTGKIGTDPIFTQTGDRPLKSKPGRTGVCPLFERKAGFDEGKQVGEAGFDRLFTTFYFQLGGDGHGGVLVRYS